MAVVILGGLTTSTFLSLVLLPILYRAFARQNTISPLCNTLEDHCVLVV